ncbi:EscU/YscU/HrcU family type III secretion system export apparatus switch protein [Escherichia coli]
MPNIQPPEKAAYVTAGDPRSSSKQSEGDPHVKGRIRQMQRAAARRRMMARCAESGCHCQ